MLARATPTVAAAYTLCFHCAQIESHTRLKQVLRRRLIHAPTRRLTHNVRLVSGQGSSAASLPHSAGPPPNIACRRRRKQGKISKAKRVSLVRVVGQRPGCAAHKSDWQPAGDLHLVARDGKSQRAKESAREASAQSVYKVFLGLCQLKYLRSALEVNNM